MVSEQELLILRILAILSCVMAFIALIIVVGADTRRRPFIIVDTNCHCDRRRSGGTIVSKM